MKIYIVVEGEYSDYHIEKVFLNGDKAKEYCEWCKGAYIEEFDTADDNLQQANFYYQVYIRYDMETNHIHIQSKKCYVEIPTEYINVVSSFAMSSSVQCIYVTKYIPNAQWKGEDYCYNKYTKMMQDIAGEVKYYLSEGYTIQQINKMLNEKFMEE